MSSPEAMTHCQQQQDFDTVARKLAQQGRPAMRPSDRIENMLVCTYYAPNGDRCAAGHLLDLSDDKAAALPNVCVTQSPVREILENDGRNVSFVTRLQSAHDVPARLHERLGSTDHSAWLLAWTRKMRGIALEYRLSPAALDEALKEHGHAT